MGLFACMAIICVWMYASFCSGIQFYICDENSLLPVNDIKKTFQVPKFECASLAHQFRAVGFYYEGSKCDLTGVEKANFPQIDGRKGQALCVLQHPDIEQATFQKTTYASPHIATNVKEYGVDGNERTMYHSDRYIVNPWFVVDFGAVMKISRVLILPRSGTSAYRFHDIEFRGGNVLATGDFSNWTLLAFYKGPYDGSTSTLSFSVNEIDARYFSIQRVTPENHMLHFYEVQVVARKVSN